MKKRGVIMPFILVGIVLLVMVGLFVMMRNYGYVGKYVPSSLVPATTFTKECVDQVTDDGLFFLRTQGGYIYLPDNIAKNPKAYVNLGLKVPYWYYNYQTRVPYIKDMELDLKNYVLDNLPGCLNEFKTVQQDLTVVNPENISSMKVKVTLNNHDIEVQVEIPVFLKSLPEPRCHGKLESLPEPRCHGC